VISRSPKILLFGENGQLGSAFRKFLDNRLLYSFGRKDANFQNLNSIAKIIKEISPQIIINAAAYTNVDEVEVEENAAHTINGIAPGVLAEEAKKIDAVFIHFSTDYVFDGIKSNPYTEKDQTNPINYYGLSKLLGEKNIQQVGGKHLIFRTSWVYNNSGNNFVTKVIKWSKELQKLKIVIDQIGSPTSSEELAKSIVRLLKENKLFSLNKKHYGIYHLGGKGAVNRFDFAKRILEFSGNHAFETSNRMEKALTEDFATIAKRPLNTALNCDKFENNFGFQLPHWNLGLFDSLKNLIDD
jgi:dTDP-4-dehydrorhamnose reductase